MVNERSTTCLPESAVRGLGSVVSRGSEDVISAVEAYELGLLKLRCRGEVSADVVWVCSRVHDVPLRNGSCSCDLIELVGGCADRMMRKVKGKEVMSFEKS